MAEVDVEGAGVEGDTHRGAVQSMPAHDDAGVCWPHGFNEVELW